MSNIINFVTPGPNFSIMEDMINNLSSRMESLEEMMEAGKELMESTLEELQLYHIPFTLEEDTTRDMIMTHLFETGLPTMDFQGTDGEDHYSIHLTFDEENEEISIVVIKVDEAGNVYSLNENNEWDKEAIQMVEDSPEEDFRESIDSCLEGEEPLSDEGKEAIIEAHRPLLRLYEMVKECMTSDAYLDDEGDIHLRLISDDPNVFGFYVDYIDGQYCLGNDILDEPIFTMNDIDKLMPYLLNAINRYHAEYTLVFPISLDCYMDMFPDKDPQVYCNGSNPNDEEKAIIENIFKTLSEREL